MSNDSSTWPSIFQSLSSMGTQGAADEHSGSFTFSIPLPSLPGARQVTPDLSLTYSSASSQSPFGLGIGLNLLRFERQTHYGVPTYTDEDTFLFNGVELIISNDAVRQITAFGQQYSVATYLPRYETNYDRIERWTRTDNNDFFWRVQDRSNRVMLFGKSSASRISDPSNKTHVFAWLQEQTFTSRGDVLLYEYKAENSDGIKSAQGPSKDLLHNGHVLGAEQYISRVFYNNRTPFLFPAFWLEEPKLDDFRFILCFDYGEYQIETSCDKIYDINDREWAVRPDPYSNYVAGFEIRTCRLCRNILLFNRLAHPEGTPVLAHQMRLSHDLNRVNSLLHRIEFIRYCYDASASTDQRYSLAPTPPLEFDYPLMDEPSTHFCEVTLPGFQIPRGIASPPYSVTDLYGEGMTNILYNDGETCLLWRPSLVKDAAGENRLVYDWPQTINRHPITSTTQVAPVYVDLEGNGTLSALMMTPRPSGYYRLRAQNDTEPYCTFTSTQSDSLLDNSVMADLSNSGTPDLVRLNNGLLEYAPCHGYEGYGSWRLVDNDVDAPACFWSGPSERVLFTNLAAPSNASLTRIRQGSIEIWPGYGNGRLGPKQTLAFEPVPVRTWNALKIFFADVTGSGYSDMIYIGRSTAYLYINQSGNSFASPIAFTIPSRIDSLGQVSFANYYGQGAAAMMVADVVNPGTIWVCDFTANSSPWLMHQVRNYTGLSQSIRYRGSVLYAIEDAQQNEPWLTTPPFSSAVVSLIETTDEVSHTRTARSFRYRDGYYDKVERIFRGYGMVSYCDTTLLYDLSHTPSDQMDNTAGPAYLAPPLLTKTWRNVGVYPLTQAWIDAQSRQFWQGDQDAYPLPQNHIAWGEDHKPDAQSIRQAYVAQAGTVERVEVYGLDDTAQASIPYTVTTSNFTIQLEQARGNRRYASFAIRSRETLTYQYERQADDPQVLQSYSLDYDAYGSLTKTADVTYKRRNPNALDGQQDTLLYAGLSSFYNHRDADQNLLGVLTDSRQFNLIQVPPPASHGYYTYAQMELLVNTALATAGSDQARVKTAQGSCSSSNGSNQSEPQAILIAQQQYNYQQVAGGNELTPQALLIQSNIAAFLGAEVAAVFAPVLGQEALTQLLMQGGYKYDENTDIWWIPGDINQFYGADSFYLNQGHQTPFGAIESRVYDETLSYVSLGTITAADVVTQEVRVEAFDFNHMVPIRRTDSNQRTSAEILDTLGMTVAETYYGFESGEPAGFAPIDTTSWPMPPSVRAVIEDPDAYLQNAAAFYYYDLFSMMGQVNEANFVSIDGDIKQLWQHLVAKSYITPEGAILAAFRALSDDKQLVVPSTFLTQQQTIYRILNEAPHGTPIHTLRVAAWNYPGLTQQEPTLALQYYDGSGRTVQTKSKVKPGHAFVIDDDGKAYFTESGNLVSRDVTDRWATSGRTLYNQKGLAYKEYEPFFTTSFLYVDDESLNQYGVSSTIHYDATYRPIRVDTAKGFFTQKSYSSWSVTSYDRDDTVTESPYYKAHPNGDGLSPWAWSALEKAAQFANTPTVTHLDNRGNQIMLSRTQEDDGEINTQFGFDAANNMIWSVDDRLAQAYPGYPSPHPNFSYHYGLNNNRLRSNSVDAGVVYTLNDVAGNLLFKQDAVGVTKSILVDALARPSCITITQAGGEPQNAVTYVYGDSLLAWSPPPIAPETHNLYGQLYTRYDQSGLVVNDSYSLRAESFGEQRRYVNSYDTFIDWGQDPASKIDSILEPTSFINALYYDALGHVTRTIDADGNTIDISFDQAGVRDTIHFTSNSGDTNAIVTHSSYNARGQITEADYGNGLTSYWGYDPQTFEMVSIITAKGDDPALIDLEFFYDPVGNLTHVSNQGVNGALGQHLADCDYTYDALYRLQIATGAQINDYSKSMQRQGGYDGLTIPIDSNPDALLERYIERYAVDSAGNLYCTSHAKEEEPSIGWTRELILSDQSNRGVDASLLEAKDSPLTPWPPPEKSLPAMQIDAFFDADGRQQEIEGVSSLSYDYHSNLRLTVTNDITEYYVIDANDRRVMKVSESTSGDGHTVSKTRYLGGLNITTVTKDDTLIGTGYHVSIGSSLDLTAQSSYQTGETPAMVYLHSGSDPSVLMQTSATGDFLSYEAYTPFGATTLVLLNGDEAQQALAHKHNRYGGHPRDHTTGLYLYGARSLMPWLGRWPNPDPAGPVDGLNIYSFINNNPTSNIDLGGFVKVKVNGVDVEITAEEIMGTWYSAATHLSKDTTGYELQSVSSVTVHSGKTLDRFVLDQPDQLFRMGSLGPFGTPKQWTKSLVDIDGKRLAFMPMYEKGIHLMWPMDEQNKQGKLPPYSDYSYAGSTAGDMVSFLESSQIPQSLSNGSWHVGALMGGPEQQRTLIAPVYGLAGLDLIQAKRQYNDTTPYTLDSFFRGVNPIFGIAGKDVAHWYKKWNQQWIDSKTVSFNEKDARSGNKWGPGKNKSDKVYGRDLYKRTNTVADQHADLILNGDGKSYSSKADALFVYQAYLLHRVGYFTPPRPSIQRTTTLTDLDLSSQSSQSRKRKRLRNAESDTEDFALEAEQSARGKFQDSFVPLKKRQKSATNSKLNKK